MADVQFLDEYDAQKAAHDILVILIRCAPNGAAQEKCSQLYNEASKHAESNFDVLKTMVGALQDGLKYGNWPWRA